MRSRAVGQAQGQAERPAEPRPGGAQLKGVARPSPGPIRLAPRLQHALTSTSGLLAVPGCARSVSPRGAKKNQYDDGAD